MARARKEAQTRRTDEEGPTAPADDSKEPTPRRWPMAFALLAVALAAVLALAGGLSLLLGGGPTPQGSTVQSPPTAGTDERGFPVEALGMPVATVGGALALIDSGNLNGRALAVAGFWVPMFRPSCGPMPGRFMAPLESHCPGQIFASSGYQDVTCQAFADGRTECHSNQPPPGVQIMNPMVLDWTNGIERMSTAANDRLWKATGVPAVLIGHAGDPRVWHCPLETRNECAREFVVDRVAWIAGEWLDLTSLDNGAAAGMLVEEAAAAAHIDGEVISAQVMPGREAPAVDPRLEVVGDERVWILRSLRPGQAVGEDPTRGVDVSVVAADTGDVIASISLDMGDAYQPARLLVQATEVGECCPGFDAYPFYRVERDDGHSVLESSINGPRSGTENNFATRFFAGLAAALEPGQYVVTAWNATLGNDGSSGPPQNQCSTEISVESLEEARVEAEFPAAGPCTFVPPTFGDNLF